MSGSSAVVVDVDARSVLEVVEQLEHDVQAVARPKDARRDEYVPPPQVAALDAGQRDRDAPAGRRALHRLVVYLHRAHAHLAPARLGAQHVPRAHGA